MVYGGNMGFGAQHIKLYQCHVNKNIGPKENSVILHIWNGYEVYKYYNRYGIYLEKDMKFTWGSGPQKSHSLWIMVGWWKEYYLKLEGKLKQTPDVSECSSYHTQRTWIAGQCLRSVCILCILMWLGTAGYSFLHSPGISYRDQIL